MGIEKLKAEFADHVLTNALKLQAYLELEGRNPVGTVSSNSASVNHLTNQLLTQNAVFLKILSGHLKTTSITCCRIKVEDHAFIPVAESKIEATPWTGEARMTHGRTQEADKDWTHVTTAMYTCICAIGKISVMLHAIDMTKDTTPDSVNQNNRKNRFDLSHLATT